MSGRNSQVSRIYWILNLLERNPQGLTISEIASRVEGQSHHVASKRTIYRDLEALSAAGFPLTNTQDDLTDTGAARWVLEKTTRISDYLVLSPRELVALFLAKQVLVPLKHTPFYEDLNRLFKKLEDKLGSKSKEHLDELSQDLHFEPAPLWGLGVDPALLDTVRAACAESQVLSCVYASANAGSKKNRRLGPHYLYFAKGSLYLVGEDLESQTVKTFSIPRMSEAEMLDETYDGEKTDPEDYFRDSIGIFRGEKPVEVKLLFSNGTAAYVRERSWHASQQVIARADGVLSPDLRAEVQRVKIHE